MPDRPLMPLARLQIAWMAGSAKVAALAAALTAAAVIMILVIGVVYARPGCRPVPVAAGKPHFACVRSGHR
jgi:hypothetical protein